MQEIIVNILSISLPIVVIILWAVVTLSIVRFALKRHKKSQPRKTRKNSAKKK